MEGQRIMAGTSTQWLDATQKREEGIGNMHIQYITNSGVITDGDVDDSPMVKRMGDIRELYPDSLCDFNGKT